MADRKARLVELDLVYAAVILGRPEATGCEPLLDGVTLYSKVAPRVRASSVSGFEDDIDGVSDGDPDGTP